MRVPKKLIPEEIEVWQERIARLLNCSPLNGFEQTTSANYSAYLEQNGFLTEPQAARLRVWFEDYHIEPDEHLLELCSKAQKRVAARRASVLETFKRFRRPD